MIIRRNSKEFKEVRDFVADHADAKDRHKKIKLFSLKPYEDLKARIPVNRSHGGEVLYEMELDTLKFNLLDAAHRLFRDERSGVYYFKTSGNSNFIELPFELVK